MSRVSGSGIGTRSVLVTGVASTAEAPDSNSNLWMSCPYIVARIGSGAIGRDGAIGAGPVACPTAVGRLFNPPSGLAGGATRAAPLDDFSSGASA